MRRVRARRGSESSQGATRGLDGRAAAVAPLHLCQILRVPGPRGGPIARELRRPGDAEQAARSPALAAEGGLVRHPRLAVATDRKSTRLNSSHPSISYAVFCLKKKKNKYEPKTNMNINARKLKQSHWNIDMKHENQRHTHISYIF